MSKIAEIKTKIIGYKDKIKSKIAKYIPKKKKDDAEEGEQEQEEKSEKTNNLIAIYHEGDKTNRRIIFLILFAMLVGVFGIYKGSMLFIKRYSLSWDSVGGTKPELEGMQKMLKKQAERAFELGRTISLGTIKFNTIDAKGNFGVASMTLWVKCDHPDMAKKLDDIYPLVHDHLLSGLTNLNPQRLLTPKGKKELRNRIRDLINEMDIKGNIEDVFLHSLVLQEGKKQLEKNKKYLK